MPQAVSRSTSAAVPRPAFGSLQTFGFWCFVLLAAAHFALRYNWGTVPFLNLASYAAGTERMPYQGRVMMALIFHQISTHPAVASLLARAGTHLPEELRAPVVIVNLAVDWIAMTAAIVASGTATYRLTGDRAFSRWAGLLTLLMAYFTLILPYGLSYTLPYDVPSLAFFCVGVALVLGRRYLWLDAIFVLGTLNRETYCFVTLFLVLYTWYSAAVAERRRSLLRVAPHVLLQAVIWIALRLWLRVHFLHNLQDTAGNGLFRLDLMHNLISLAKPPQWPLFLSLFGFTLPFILANLKYIGDRAYARSISIVLVLWIAAMMLVGVIVEVRVFNELAAFLAPALGAIAWHRWYAKGEKA